jgi:thiol:disulfide interchange protein DsbA
MKRRHFSIALAAVPFAASSVWAADEAIEGKTFIRLKQPVPVSASKKVEVVEFFGYWCPHCNHLEPTLEAWVKKLPASVSFRRSPVAWQEGHIALQKLYFGLEALGLVDTMHAKVFLAIHVQRQRMTTDADIAAFAQANGIDKAKLANAMNDFAASNKVRVANQMMTAYQVEGVPTFGVQGQFVTSPEMANGEEQALRVIDALVRKVKV